MVNLSFEKLPLCLSYTDSALFFSKKYPLAFICPPLLDSALKLPLSFPRINLIHPAVQIASLPLLAHSCLIQLLG